MNIVAGAPTRARLTFCVGAALAVFAFAAPNADAFLAAKTTNCDPQTVSNPFTPWGDYADYVLAPDGAAENGADEWVLRGGAAVVTGNSPFYAHGATDTHSVLIPKGGTAETATMCIGKEHPTIRFFAQNTGTLSSVLEVRLIVETAFGREYSLPIGLERGNSDWGPSNSMRLLVNSLNLREDTYTPVEFEFTARGGGWRIDDVYVDPRRH